MTHSIDALKPDITMERNTVHGDFAQNAMFSQNMKIIMHSKEGWHRLNFEQQEALEMIALKISRILSGRANYEDHWLDIEGYAILGRKSCTTS